MSNTKGFWRTLTPEQQKAALEYRGPENIGPCMKYCAVLDECNARGDAIKRLTRERDEARKWQSVAAELSDKLHGTPCAEIRWEYERQDLQSRAEAADRKVEKLREALAPFAEAVISFSTTAPDDIDVEVTAGDVRRARAALAETEDSHE